MFSTRPSELLLSVLLLISCLQFACAKDVHRMKNTDNLNFSPKQNDDDMGRLTSCISQHNDTFKFEWKPKILKPQVTFWFNVSITLAEEFSNANISVKIWLKGIDDPIYVDSGLTTCNKTLPFFKKFFKDFTCPAKKDYQMKAVLPYKLDPSVPLPAGNYKLRTEVRNEAQKMVVCIEGDVSIED